MKNNSNFQLVRVTFGFPRLRDGLSDNDFLAKQESDCVKTIFFLSGLFSYQCIFFGTRPCTFIFQIWVNFLSIGGPRYSSTFYLRIRLFTLGEMI